MHAMIRRSRGLLLMVGGTLAGMLVGCRRESAEPAPSPPAEVTFITLTPEVVPIRYEWVAQTVASRTVEIRARVPGFLTRRPFEEGGSVDEGALLFQIDQRSYLADLEIARARLAQAEARLALADVTLQRVKAAAAQGGTNQQELDEKSAQRKEAEAAVQLAKGTLAKAELDLSYTTILAPMPGRIGTSPVYEGAYVDAGPNSLLATVVASDPIYVAFSISEREILSWQRAVEAGRIRFEGDPEPPANLTSEQLRELRMQRSRDAKVKVEITLIDGATYPHIGELNFIDVVVNPQTGTAFVRADVPNPEERLKPGQFVKAALLGWERPNTLVVPQRAVVQQPTGQFVYVVGEGDKAELRGITTGQWHEDGWIVDSGLAPGDRVIVDGTLRIQPGVPIKPTPAPQAAPRTDAGSAR